MKTLFCSQELWDLVENGFTEPPDQAAYNVLSQAQKDLLKENKKKDAKALIFIQQAMEESVFPTGCSSYKVQACMGHSTKILSRY